MTDQREEWIKCIRRADSKAFCGRDITHDWAFVDLQHALRTEEQGGRLVPCAECYDIALEPNVY